MKKTTNTEVHEIEVHKNFINMVDKQELENTEKKTVSVILIDAKEQEVKEIELPKEFGTKTITTTIGEKTRWFERYLLGILPAFSDNDLFGNVYIYMDENGTQNYPEDCFYFQGLTEQGRPLAGNALIIRYTMDEEGEELKVVSNYFDIADIRDLVMFLPFDKYQFNKNKKKISKNFLLS